MKKNLFLVIGTIVFTVTFFACNENQSEEAEDKSTSGVNEEGLYKKANTYFSALPQQAPTDQYQSTDEKIKLGKVLYFDKRLSKAGNISCNSCHQLDNFGVDGEKTSLGDTDERGPRNSPTTFNAALQFSQFWDGRAKDVEEQAGMPILNPIEHAIPNENFLINRLKGIELYQSLFSQAFPEQSNPINYTNLKYAIAAFERTLLTPSRFDQYLKGDKKALTAQEKRGMEKFIETGCITCHSSELVGGKMFNKFGVHGDYWELTKSESIDEGRYEVTGEESDKYIFKVPSLRNVEHTAPYFHDGSVDSLGKAVTIMAKLQNNIDLSEEDRDDIVAFLKSLSSDISVMKKTPPEELPKKHYE